MVVDVAGIGGGGAGGGFVTTTSTGSSTNPTGGSTCGNVSCAVSDDGACECSGACNEQKLQVICTPIAGGASCTCIENGIKIAVCSQPGSATCSFLDECCATEFFGQAGSGG
ncbi:Hypothetical protein A7982_03508 [Minicystis rosea]|nr:Hypothetical protein A7982_03508 [Minicystis rosea]